MIFGRAKISNRIRGARESREEESVELKWFNKKSKWRRASPSHSHYRGDVLGRN